MAFDAYFWSAGEHQDLQYQPGAVPSVFDLSSYHATLQQQVHKQTNTTTPAPVGQSQIHQAPANINMRGDTSHTTRGRDTTDAHSQRACRAGSSHQEKKALAMMLLDVDSPCSDSL